MDNVNMTNRRTGDKVLRCICNCIYSDDFMIQCDQCYIWQHVICVGLDGKHIPDDYYCEECVPRPVNKDYANSVQTKLGNTSDKTVASNQEYDQPITTIPKLDVKMYDKLIRIAAKSALIKASSPVAQIRELISGVDSHNDISNSGKRLSDEDTRNNETYCTICGEMQDPNQLKPDGNNEKISQAPNLEMSEIHCRKSLLITNKAKFIETAPPSLSGSNFDSSGFNHGDDVLVFDGAALEKAKVIAVEKNAPIKFKVHYMDWSDDYDEWVSSSRLMKISTECLRLKWNIDVRSHLLHKTCKKSDSNLSSSKPPDHFKKGHKVLIYYDRQLYNGNIKMKKCNQFIYRVHYTGWHKEWDEWVPAERLFEPSDEIRLAQKNLLEFANSLATIEPNMQNDQLDKYNASTKRSKKDTEASAIDNENEKSPSMNCTNDQNSTNEWIKCTCGKSYHKSCAINKWLSSLSQDFMCSKILESCNHQGTNIEKASKSLGSFCRKPNKRMNFSEKAEVIDVETNIDIIPNHGRITDAEKLKYTLQISPKKLSLKRKNLVTKKTDTNKKKISEDAAKRFQLKSVVCTNRKTCSRRISNGKGSNMRSNISSMMDIATDIPTSNTNSNPVRKLWLDSIPLENRQKEICKDIVNNLIAETTEDLDIELKKKLEE